MTDRFDLHTHSCFSDGSFTPTELVRAAAEAGLSLVALTDHDGVDGVPEALSAGREAGLRVLAGVEFDCAWPHELHLLGIGIDAEDPKLCAAVGEARARRSARNERILKQLLAAGMDIRPYMQGGDCTTRLHIALALVDAGFASSPREAFQKHLNMGGAGYVAGYRESCIKPDRAMEIIAKAGGLSVWAHPMHAPADLHKLTAYLKECGLGGIEVYHPSVTEGGAELLLSLAAQYDLRVSCGSDFHGAYRSGVTLGCTWRDCPQLRRTYEYFMR